MSDQNSSPKYKGKKTAKLLQNGPVTKRGCTDVLCALMFISTIVGMIFVAIYGFSNGDPAALVAPYDQFGNPCGLGDQAGFPYLYFRLDKDQNIQADQTVCLEQCPVDENDTLNCAPDFKKSGSECSEEPRYATSPLVHRLCIPKNQTYTDFLVDKGALNMNVLFKATSDLSQGWWMIACAGLIGILLGYMYMVFMRFCSGVVTWGLLVFYEIGLLGFGGICYLEAINSPIAGNIAPDALSSVSPAALKLIGYTCFGIAGISLLLMCLLQGRIKLAVAVLKASVNFVEDVRTVMLVPPFFFLLSLIFYIFWIFSFMYLMGSNDINHETNKLPFANVSWNNMARWLMIVHIFGLVWVHAFFHAIPQFVIASTACLWYFRKAKSQESPIIVSLCRSILHLGSIAMGALLIGILDYFRLMVKIIEKPLRAAKRGKNNCCARYFGNCARSCLGCFEACLKFINRHAYVQIAMTGKGFCHATRDAYYLILRNNVRFGTLHGLGAVFVFFGQVFITFMSTFIGYLLIRNITYFQENLFSPLVLTLFCFLLSLILGHTFMSVYGVAADSIIHCYAMDDELHDGGAKHAPRYLEDLVNRHARKVPLLKGNNNDSLNDNEA